MNEFYSEQILGDYFFKGKSDFLRATKEQETIEKLRENIAGSNKEETLQLYNKMISKNYFSTPIGYAFLKEIRDGLVSFYGEENVPKIPVPRAKVAKNKNMISKEEYDSLKEDYEKQKSVKTKLIIVIIALVVLVFGMILIALTNNNVGYFRTEEKVLDKYSAWEEDLKEREQIIRDKEEELGIKNAY